MRGRRLVVAMFVLAMGVAAGAGQEPLGTEAVHARLLAYLNEYEQDLGQFVATEELTQWPLHGGLFREQPRRDITQPHRLVSDVAFVSLPGGAGWLGFRDVREVKGKAVKRQGPALAALLASPTDDGRARAQALLQAGARYNLGAPRTINLPNLPLELLHARNRARYTLEESGRDRVGDCPTVLRMTFVESARPTIVQRPTGGDMPSRVTAWVDPVSGALCRGEVRIRDAQFGVQAVDAVVRVDFEYDEFLDLRLPVRMYEEFLYPPRSRGEGEAMYTNYRRFTTSARIVPNGLAAP